MAVPGGGRRLSVGRWDRDFLGVESEVVVLHGGWKEVVVVGVEVGILCNG